jgi:hypothetical protein
VLISGIIPTAIMLRPLTICSTSNYESIYLWWRIILLRI